MGCSYSHGPGYNSGAAGMYGGMMLPQTQYFNKGKPKGGNYIYILI
jgi:hypothetical protein